MKIFASCHNHSCFSDANYTPEELVQIAHDLGHGGIILTDHDTVSGTYFINSNDRKSSVGHLLCRQSFFLVFCVQLLVYET